MSDKTVCDECEVMAPIPSNLDTWLHVAERVEVITAVRAETGPWDFCSLRCLASWAHRKEARFAEISRHSEFYGVPVTVNG